MRPFIARMTGEPLPSMDEVIGRDGRVGYPDETPADRDARGVLWLRQVHAPTDGVPSYGCTHAARQRHAALYLLCQICGADPDENAEGVLWLLPGRLVTDDDRAIITTYPPVCGPCAQLALQQCPPLRRAHTLLRVSDVDVYGVFGAAFTFTATGIVCGEPAEHAYSDPAITRVVAAQQLLRLLDYRPADTL